MKAGAELARVAGTAVLGVALLCAWAATPAPVAGQEREAAEQAVGEDAAVAAARSLLEAITTGDTALFRSVTAEDLRLEGTSTGDPLPDAAEGGDRDSFLATISRPGVDFVERMWDPTVRVEGRIAEVRAPYDFYRDGELSHCGIDLFHLVKTAAGWQVVSVIWTAGRPPDCELHPDGPPAGDGAGEEGPA